MGLGNDPQIVEGVDIESVSVVLLTAVVTHPLAMPLHALLLAMQTDEVAVVAGHDHRGVEGGER